MHTAITALIGLIGALGWLLLLVATQFNGVVVATGLLGVVLIMGRAAGDVRQHDGGKPRGTH
jgi:hypothetical protein